MLPIPEGREKWPPEVAIYASSNKSQSLSKTANWVVNGCKCLTEILFIFHLFQISSFVFLIDHDGKYHGTNLCRYGAIVHAKPFQQHVALLA